MNTQAIEHVESRKDGKLDVVKIWRTIQGEGPFVGTPAVFVRLAGCNLQCPLCDTDYTSQRDVFTPLDILSRASILVPFGQQHQKFIVLTGGEPFRQNLVPFLYEAVKFRWHIQIETNGAFVPRNFFSDIFSIRKDITIVCSPKTVISGALTTGADAWKYVVRAGYINPEDGLPTHALDNKTPVQRPNGLNPQITYIQPCDEGNETLNRANMATAVNSCLRFGYKLCLQVHKIAGLE